VGHDLLIIEVLWSHSDTPHSVGLLWESDQPDAGTSTWQHTTFTTDIHVPGGIRTYNPSSRAASDPRLRPRGHWNRSRIELPKIIKYYRPKARRNQQRPLKKLLNVWDRNVSTSDRTAWQLDDDDDDDDDDILTKWP
jgi:hypothetical protein